MTEAQHLESTLVTSLATVLGLDDVDAQTSLFLAGGSSMHAEIYARTASAASGHTITFTDIFQYPTPSELAHALRERTARPSSTPEPSQRNTGDWHPVSENQASRLERLRRSETAGVHLFRSNVELVVAGYDLVGALDRDSLRAAVAEVVERNGVLRTVFDWRGGSFRQRVEPAPFGLEVLESGLLPRDIIDLVWAPLVLDSGQLARFILAPSAPDRHQLWIVMEHIVSDAVSLGRVVALVAEAYTRRMTGIGAGPAPTRDIEGLEFAYLEESLCTDGPGLQAEEHWLRQIGDGPVWRALRHPALSPYVENHAAEDVYLGRVVDRDVGSRLGRRASSLGTTLHALVVFALVRAAAAATGERDVTVYWYTGNRNLPDVATTIGSLAGITMVRIPNVPDGPTDEDIVAVTGEVGKSMANAFYPIDRIARVHRPQDRIVPDDRPLLVLHVNPEPLGDDDESLPQFAGLEVSNASRAGRRDRRGFTVDASIRFTPTSFVIGLSHRAGMLEPRAAQAMLDLFADELLALAGSDQRSIEKERV